MCGENALLAHETKYKKIFEHSPFGIIYFDVRRRILECNRAFASILGTSVEALTGFDMGAKLENGQMLAAVDRALATGEAFFDGPYTSVTTGKALYLKAEFSAVRDETGRIVAAIGLFEDTTERMQLQHSVRYAHEQYRQLFERNRAVMMLINPDEHGRIVKANEAAERFYGYDAKEFASLYISDINTLDEEDIRREMALAKAEKRSTFYFRHRLKSGEIREVEVHSGPIDVYGQELLYSIVNDVTEKKRLEKALETHHQYLQNVIDGMRESVMVIGTDYTVKLMNRMARRMYNEAWISDPEHPKCYEISHHHHMPCDGQSHQCPIQIAQQTGQTARTLHTHYDSNGNERIIELTATPMRDADGNITAFIESGHDVTSLLNARKMAQDYATAIELQTHYDTLTGLPNHVMFLKRLEEKLEAAKRYGKMLAMVMIDIDHIKSVNDSFGHQTGDCAIEFVASKLRASQHEENILARYHGDSFMLLLENAEDEYAIVETVRGMTEMLEESAFHVHDHVLHLTVSCGISLYPQDGETPETLIKNADAALFKTKDRGRNGYSFYTQELTDRAYERVTLESSLRKAVKAQEFRLAYHPQFDGRDGRLVGVEALLRWNHPDYGEVSPLKFVPALEHSGLIVPLGFWTLRTAFAQAAAWRSRGIDPGRIAVNVSVKQLEDQEQFLANVSKIVEETGCRPEWIELELTESQLMTDPRQTADVLQRLSDMGFSIAIDDFGTGYSSLSYLKRLPIDKLKIDRTFICDLPNDDEDAAISKAVIALAKTLKLNVVAEGVETEAQKAFLVQNGCCIIQGFLYTEPVDSDRLETFF